MIPIKDFDGYYITKEGKVFCDLGRGNKDRSRVKRCEPYEINPRVARNGYMRVYMRNTVNFKRYDRYIHRLVAEYFIKKPEGKNVVNHKDCDRSNNHVNNLEWVTTKENIEYAMKVGNLKRCPITGRMISGIN
ncbi:MAG: HNH endonuclease signature motif containing protein [Cetobacterium sp.]